MILKLKRTPGIYLVGFMASGKTTIGRQLADELGWAFIDIDDDIEAKAGKVISRIFDEDGEPAFRKIEHDALAARVDQVRHSHPLVLALGGGAYVQQNNFDLVNDHGITIWLDCAWERIQQRVAGASHRPLARDPAAFEQLYQDRRASYAKADYRVEVTSDDPRETVNKILEATGLQ